MILQNRILLILLPVLIVVNLHGQDSTNYISPVSWPIKLSGTFGELRPGHFHMGIDIKSPNGGVGHGLRSIDDGYVSRIKVSSGGYGKVLYIIHPTGHESVYAHMQAFIPEIEDFVKTQQYEQQSYEVDLALFPDQFLVNKGQTIGQMGMTGRTFGPHLHFELRDKWTGKGLNPLAYGIPVEDKEAPKLYQIVVYELDHNNQVIKYSKIQGESIPKQVLVGSKRIGIGVKAYDRMGGVRNLNGVHRIEMKVDQELAFAFDCDTLDHGMQRYINAHKDYALFQEEAAYVNRMYKIKGNNLDIYSTDSNNGVILMDDNLSKSVNIQLEDSFGNQRNIQLQLVPVEGEEGTISAIFNHEIKYDQTSRYELGEMRVDFKPGNVYDNVFAKITTSPLDSSGTKVYHIHNRNEPVHTPYRLSICPTNTIDSLKSKYFISGVNSKGDKANFGGQWHGDTISTMLNGFGDYTISIDTVPPSLDKHSFQYDLTKAYTMSFTIKDQVPRAYLRYKTLVDGEWILMEYDAKKDRLTHFFDGRIGQGEHQLSISVEDRNGNKTEKMYTFMR